MLMRKRYKSIHDIVFTKYRKLCTCIFCNGEKIVNCVGIIVGAKKALSLRNAVNNIELLIRIQPCFAVNSPPFARTLTCNTYHERRRELRF